MTPPQCMTVSGLLVDLLDPQLDQIRLDDIIHALAATPRYNGHTARHYSVAEHSIAVRRCVAETLRAIGVPTVDAIQIERAALLHDAAEAYTGDLISPVKRWIDLASAGAWSRLECGLDDAIATRFGLVATARQHPVIHAVDSGPVFAAECIAFGRPAAPGSTPWPRFRARCWPPDLAAARLRAECVIVGLCDW